MTQRSNLFSEHARQYAEALRECPTLTLSVYCKRHLVSYTGLRKWMFVHNMKPTELKRSRRKNGGTSGGFVMLSGPQISDERDAADVLRDVTISFSDGVSVSIGSAGAESLTLLLQKIIRPCSH